MQDDKKHPVETDKTAVTGEQDGQLAKPDAENEKIDDAEDNTDDYVIVESGLGIDE